MQRPDQIADLVKTMVDTFAASPMLNTDESRAITRLFFYRLIDNNRGGFGDDTGGRSWLEGKILDSFPLTIRP